MVQSLLILIPTAAVLMIATFGWLDAPRAAGRRAGKLATGAGLAFDDGIRVLVERRLRRRQRGMMVGMVAGAVVGSLPVLAAAGDLRAAIAWWMAVYLAATGLGALVVHVVDSGRTAAEPGSRAAVLRPRRLLDFMYPVEVVAPYVALVLPALAVLISSTSTGEESATQALWLVIGAGIAVVVTVAAVLAQRLVLHMAPPADSPNRLKWEDALRGIALRDLGVTAAGTSIVLGGAAAAASATGALTGYPPALSGVVQLTALLGVVGMVVLVVVTESSASPARRFLRLYEAGQR